jgi:hypothetical protein
MKTKKTQRKSMTEQTSLLTYQPANSVEQCHSWGASSSLAGRELSRILWRQMSHYRVHESQPLVHILSQINPVHNLLSCFLGGPSLVCCPWLLIQYICSCPPYLEGGSFICRVSYLAILLEIYQVIHDCLDRLLSRILWQNTITFSVNFLENELLTRLKEVSFKVWLILWLQHDGAVAHFGQVTGQLNCWYGYRWIGRGGLQIWVPRSPDVTSFGLILLGTYEPVGLWRVNLRRERTGENHGRFSSHSEESSGPQTGCKASGPGVDNGGHLELKVA